MLLLTKASMPAALAKLERFSGVAIEGHPDVTFDGVFKLHSTHEGWPVLRSDQDKCESTTVLPVTA